MLQRNNCHGSSGYQGPQLSADSIAGVPNVTGASSLAASRKASIKGESGSRSATTRPTLCSSFGSASGIARIPDTLPNTSNMYCGMIEVAIGALVSILTTLVLFPSRAGRAFADNVAQTLPPMFALLASALRTALGGEHDAAFVTSTSAKVRANFAAGDALARQTQLEVAGFLAGRSDPDAVLRTLRRLRHTEIILNGEDAEATVWDWLESLDQPSMTLHDLAQRHVVRV